MAEEEESAAQGGLWSYVGVALLGRGRCGVCMICILGLDVKDENMYVMVQCFLIALLATCVCVVYAAILLK